MIDIVTTGSGIPDLDAMAAASREVARQTYPFNYMGREWTARNSVPFGTLATALDGEDVGLKDVLTMAAQYLVEDQRADFEKAVLESEDVTVDEMQMLAEFFNSRVKEATGNSAT